MFFCFFVANKKIYKCLNVRKLKFIKLLQSLYG